MQFSIVCRAMLFTQETSEIACCFEGEEVHFCFLLRLFFIFSSSPFYFFEGGSVHRFLLFISFSFVLFSFQFFRFCVFEGLSFRLLAFSVFHLFRWVCVLFLRAVHFGKKDP